MSFWRIAALAVFLSLLMTGCAQRRVYYAPAPYYPPPPVVIVHH